MFLYRTIDEHENNLSPVRLLIRYTLLAKLSWSFKTLDLYKRKKNIHTGSRFPILEGPLHHVPNIMSRHQRHYFNNARLPITDYRLPYIFGIAITARRPMCVNGRLVMGLCNTDGHFAIIYFSLCIYIYLDNFTCSRVYLDGNIC